MKKARQGKIGKITKLQTEQKNLIEQLLGIGLVLDKAKANKRTEAKFDPLKLDLIIRFDAHWGAEYNTLLADDAENLFLADTEESSHQGLSVCVHSFYIPIKNTTEENFKKIDLKQALSWYSRCEPWAGSSLGTVNLICKMAAERL